MLDVSEIADPTTEAKIQCLASSGSSSSIAVHVAQQAQYSSVFQTLSQYLERFVCYGIRDITIAFLSVTFYIYRR